MAIIDRSVSVRCSIGFSVCERVQRWIHVETRPSAVSLRPRLSVMMKTMPMQASPMSFTSSPSRTRPMSIMTHEAMKPVRPRSVGREDHRARDHDGHQDRPCPLAPDAALFGRRTPRPELERRDDAYFVDFRLPSGQLPGQEQYRGDLQRLGGLELERPEGYPAGGAVGRGADEIDGDGERYRKEIDGRENRL